MPYPFSALLLAALCSPALAVAQDFDIASQVDGIAVARVQELPVNETPLGDAFCNSINPEPPRTASGQAVSAAGWQVTSEVEAEGMDFVAFVGQIEHGTSGSCLLGQGNIGIFVDGALQALAYAPEGSARSIGSIEPLPQGGVRVWDGDYLPLPLSDLRIHDGNLVIAAPLASVDSFCDGTSAVPMVYSLPIHVARRMLTEAGWDPAEGDAVCSGTGFGYCIWEYRAENGALLSVQTAGEGPEGSSPPVSGYAVDCQG